MKKTKKPRMTNEELAAIRIVLNRVLSVMDGKQHGSSQCSVPIGRNIFIESWIVPYLEALLEHGNGGEKLPNWVTQ